MSNPETEMMRAFGALRLELPASIVDDVWAKTQAVLDAKQAETDRIHKAADETEAMLLRRINHFEKELQESNRYCERLEEALRESLALNENWVSTAEPEDLAYYSEYKTVIEQAQAALKQPKENSTNDQ